MKILTNTLLMDLKYTIDASTLAGFSQRYTREMLNPSQNFEDKISTAEIQTPSTVETTFKRGCAISKARRCQRPNSKSKEKMR